ncbi:prolyl oligopeptidase family serine peptidase [Schaalia vaccimaxillae]|uniref:prolyl oligopeptidase family serine peptidase n=1 Tax=Schaalia vaccimaxillae TaxID=183916 RepID=UPI0003B4EFFD|nr:prolyl oligopeptidase family serine peptidase [Schaalia vaccimaxillae]
MMSAQFFESNPTQRRAPKWLDDIHGAQALAWARERNSEAEHALGGPIFDDLKRNIFEVLTSPDRIPGVRIRGEWAYNFWTDESHPRGLWRRQNSDAYLEGEDQWEVLIDVDALAEQENRSLVWHGASVLFPQRNRALVDLSEAGSDADETREFDLDTKTWVLPESSPFHRPTAKGSLSWVSRDRAWARTDFGEGTMSASGYPLQARLLDRGQELSDAPLLVQGLPCDLGVFVGTDLTPGFERSWVQVAHDFMNSTTWLIPHPITVATRDEDGRIVPANAHRIDIPSDASLSTWREWMLVSPRVEWILKDHTFPAGCLVAFRLDDFLAGTIQPEVLFQPDSHTCLQGMTTTLNHLVLSTLVDVVPTLTVLTPPTQDGKWSRRDLDVTRLGVKGLHVPPLCHASAGEVSPIDDDRLWLTVSGFTTPTSLLITELDALTGAPQATRVVRHGPEMFDATGVEVSQHFATSADGTRVPYFQVGRPAGHPLFNANAPTLLYGYGGFGINQTPGYSGVLGRALLSKGGTYVVANIRGGGEYGPDWHEAARAQNKHRSYEDFEAVALDLISRGVTTPSRLGIRGGSNGGLLTGNMYVRSPQLFGAVVIQAPLLDMRRYTSMLAGASWIAEYGNPNDPQQWEWVQQFSPFHLWDPAQNYPPVLVTTSTADDRVHPAHARTFAWMLREGLADVTYYENIEGGHSGAADAQQRAHMDALVWSFLWQTLGR